MHLVRGGRGTHGNERAAETPSPPTLPPPHERALIFEIQVTGKSGALVSSIGSKPLPSQLSINATATSDADNSNSKNDLQHLSFHDYNHDFTC